MSGVLNSVTAIFGSIQNTFQNVLDRIFPPEKRAEVFAKLQAFAINNPKLAAFLTTQIVLTGFPLLLFVAFTLTIFLFSLIVALVLGLLAAVLFTVFMVGVALLVVLPTVFMTTFSASFLFLWGLGGYYILKWFNEGDAPAPEGSAIGDKINSLTGGRMSWFMDGARKKQDDARTGVDQTPKVHGSEESNGGMPDVKKHVNEGKEQVTKQADGVTKRLNKSTGGVTGVTNAAGTAKGAVSGTTGLG
ncbi:uncharacterized protein BDR25DRAFT_280824 [Lindgomyces ingoldianus]|uniref:Uncharacterized protein n=1 Tax=Lindgomyces ingoldianus TaxID=673940 RepID=A0ACB6R5P4_9PLEO|nr:uncharacterized protein BDR25DRAFT_280824 [Lindgomyces ingoldianus]KAF2474100.1 hypothetical protein BDR25DRAFT_280824 [Lindgomyces ingoldianus]